MQTVLKHLNISHNEMHLHNLKNWGPEATNSGMQAKLWPQ